MPLVVLRRETSVGIARGFGLDGRSSTPSRGKTLSLLSAVKRSGVELTTHLLLVLKTTVVELHIFMRDTSPSR
jgi:hypothetical protein